jgi:hypothetical protein
LLPLGFRHQETVDWLLKIIGLVSKVKALSLVESGEKKGSDVPDTKYPACVHLKNIPSEKQMLMPPLGNGLWATGGAVVSVHCLAERATGRHKGEW